MYTAEFDAFKQTLSDLCTAVNRPFNDDLCRVFWEDLRPYSLLEVQVRANRLRREGQQKFKSADLRPELKAQGTYEPPRTDLDHFDRLGNKQFLKFLQLYDTKPEHLRSLLDRKNEIIAAARNDPEMQPRGEEYEFEQGQQLHEILFPAWRKVIGSTQLPRKHPDGFMHIGAA